MIVDWNPVMVEIGPLAVRWYGFFMALSVAVGFYYLRRDGVRIGYDLDFLYNIALLSVIGGVIGARLVYVATNWELYANGLAAVIRIDQGGLSFHGGVIGGALTGAWYARARGRSVLQLMDLAVPGIATGIILVRIGNLFNGEVLGRMTEIGFGRHPAQLYGSLIGVALLILHNVIARRRPPAGYLFWSFAFYYSILRGLFEETFRQNPLYLWGYVNETLGIGLFTLTHLVTVPFVLLAWQQRRAALQRSPGRRHWRDRVT